MQRRSQKGINDGKVVEFEAVLEVFTKEEDVRVEAGAWKHPLHFVGMERRSPGLRRVMRLPVEYTNFLTSDERFL